MIIFEYGAWETEYIINDLLPKQELRFVPSQYLEQVDSSCDVFVFSCREHDFWEIRNTIRKIKPKIIIMISDEFHQENLYNYNSLGFECKLFLRNYHHPYYNYTPNTIVFPLGYTNGCKTFTPMKKYDWSFVGKIKSDRQKMIDVFSKNSNHYMSTNLSQNEMCRLYSQSYFVPCGRGNSSLDCFRLYEASMNGAIPVVVGTKEEIDITFKYGNNPPWIFAESWEMAYNECNSLLKNPKALELHQTKLLSWWKNRIQFIRNQITNALQI